MRSLVGLCFALALMVSACAAAPPQVPEAQPSPAPPEKSPPSEFDDQRWGKVPLPRLALELSLPSPNEWRLDDGKGAFSATHEPTESVLAILTWAAPRNVRPRECEADARIRRPTLPLVDESEIIDRSRVNLPDGFDSELTLLVIQSKDPGYIDGHALLFGARLLGSTGRCIAFAFATRAGGQANSQETIARRLRIASDGIFRTVRPLNVEERARPERPNE